MNGNPEAEVWIKILPGQGEGGHMYGVYTKDSQFIDIRKDENGNFYVQYMYGKILRISVEDFDKLRVALKNRVPLEDIKEIYEGINHLGVVELAEA